MSELSWRREQLLEPCAVKVARTVLRGGKSINALPLPDVRYEAAFDERKGILG
jgi:hypothetical protein